MHAIGRTAGLEIEFFQAPMDFLNRHPLRSHGWQIVRDGSTTHEVRMLGNMQVVDAPYEIGRFIERRQIGGELVSPPFNLDEGSRLLDDTITALELLRTHGETDISDSASVHVHCYVGQPPAYVIRNLVWLWQALEAVLYRLAVAESEVHRGVIHKDYMYCRPLSGFGPQIVRDERDDYRWCFDLEKVLRAKTTTDMIRAFGRADYLPNKWMPFRYYGLNIGPIVRQETVEFRIFNATMRPDYIQAWVELCLALVRLAYMDYKVSEYPKFNLGLHTPDDGTEFTFGTLTQMVPPSLISDSSWYALDALWNLHEWQTGPAGYQVNHLNKRVPLRELPKALLPDLVPSKILNQALDRLAEEED